MLPNQASGQSLVLEVDREPGVLRHGWQRTATVPIHSRLSEQALFRSQGGPLSSAPFTYFRTSPFALESARGRRQGHTNVMLRDLDLLPMDRVDAQRLEVVADAHRLLWTQHSSHLCDEMAPHMRVLAKTAPLSSEPPAGKSAHTLNCLVNMAEPGSPGQ